MPENETAKYEGVRCAECGSEDWEKRGGASAAASAVACWGAFFISIWIPIVGWIAAPFLLLGAVIFTGVALFGSGPTEPTVHAVCKRCHARIELEKQTT